MVLSVFAYLSANHTAISPQIHHKNLLTFEEIKLPKVVGGEAVCESPVMMAPSADSTAAPTGKRL